MRTTIELRDDQRARLLELAARRGEKGFSAVVQEAVDLFFLEEDRRAKRLDSAASVLGTVSEDAADRMRERIRSLRERWR